MRSVKIIRISVLLSVCALAFLAVQGLLILRSYDLVRKEFGLRVPMEANDAFFRVRSDEGAMEALGREVLSDPAGLRSEAMRARIIAKAQEALMEYQGFGDSLRQKMTGAGIGVPFRHAITLNALSFRNGARGTISVLDAQSPDQEQVLFGDLRDLSSPAVNSSFHYMGRNHYYRVNLYIQFPRFTLYALGRMKGLLAVSFMSLAVFAGACVAILRTIRQQERLSAMKSDFINTMTHELNTPLSTITIAARTLKHADARKDPAALEQLADVILRQNLRLQRMIDGVMRISFREGPQGSLSLEPVSLHDLLAGAAKDLRLQYVERQVLVREEYRAERDTLVVDSSLMLSALFNLLDNAVKYSEGTPEIGIWTRNEKTEFQIGITDRGVGISSRHRPFVFEKFFRIPDRNPNRAGGLGLGLHTVWRIIEAHGGRISVSRRKGGGSEFTITLPMEPRDDGAHSV